MPKAHQAHAEWTPTKLIEWAKKTGPATAALVEETMRRRVHAQHDFRACLGVLHLNRKYEAARIEAACARALRLRACSYKSVAAILKNNLDREPAVEQPRLSALPTHSNVRGSDYYH